MRSIEEKVEDHYKKILDRYEVRHYGKTEPINDSITKALRLAASKCGGSGINYPDIKLLLSSSFRRDIPVMIEAKGSKGKLEKLDPDGGIVGVTPYKTDGKNHKKGDPNWSAIEEYAVNGALHYGRAVLAGHEYDEVVVIGINGTALDGDGNVKDPEAKAYYVSRRNDCAPKLIEDFDFARLKASGIDSFFAELDALSLTDKEREKLKRDREEALEESIKAIHQRIYDDSDVKQLLGTNDKLYLFCGLIMAGLTTEGVRPLTVSDLHSNDDADDNDGKVVITRAKSFLKKKGCSDEKVKMVLGYLEPVFDKRDLWKPVNGESVLRSIYRQVEDDILPLLEGTIHLDFTGKILNSLNDWVSIENDKLNDVVLTPRSVTKLMARICRTDRDSFVWDTCMGSSGFLVSAMDLMVADARESIKDPDELEAKLGNIKHNQLLGIEILGNIYILAVLNMILMGDGSSNVVCGDSHELVPALKDERGSDFPANVFLLNPPYSAPGKGLVFVEEALEQMESGYGAVLIQENAGAGQGDVYAKRILERNTLRASVHMPADLFIGKASVQTSIYLFEVSRPHEDDDEVVFIDFSEDGYARQNRKKSTSRVNLRDADHALERYDEVAALCMGKRPKTSYYTEANGKLIRDTVSLDGDDWTFNQHRVIDTTPTRDDFKKVVADYLAWKVGAILRGEASA
jgi:type I restriction enzyme M protein